MYWKTYQILSGVIINNYYNPEVNEPIRVKFTYDPITHQVQINSLLAEKNK